jgi:hypothetical protein
VWLIVVAQPPAITIANENSNGVALAVCSVLTIPSAHPSKPAARLGGWSLQGGAPSHGPVAGLSRDPAELQWLPVCKMPATAWGRWNAP